MRLVGGGWAVWVVTGVSGFRGIVRRGVCQGICPRWESGICRVGDLSAVGSVGSDLGSGFCQRVIRGRGFVAAEVGSLGLVNWGFCRRRFCPMVPVEWVGQVCLPGVCPVRMTGSVFARGGPFFGL